MNKKFLHVQPCELKFPFRLNRLSICWLQLTNIKPDHNIAFKVKTTHPKKYCVRPNVGIIPPGSTCVVKVSLQAQKANPLAIPKDKFLVQSIIAPVGLTSEKTTSQLFKKETVDLEERKLRVVFVTKNPPSPIPEGPEDECSPEDWNTVLKLIDEKLRLLQENQELRYDMGIVRKQIKTVKSRNVVILVTLSVWLLGFVIGYFIK